jgi:hypothetical protein
VPGEPHTIPEHKKTWVCIDCIRAWEVEETPVCPICKSVAIECQYCGTYKPDYECYNVQFVSDGGEGNEVISEAEEMCNICLNTFCIEHDIEINFEILDTVADEVKKGINGYGKMDEEDIL